MRLFLALAAFGAFVTVASFVVPSADAVGICVYDDVYSNVPSAPECQGVVCYGYSNGQWHDCVPPGPPPCTIISC